jgi:cell division protein FtsB
MKETIAELKNENNNMKQKIIDLESENQTMKTQLAQLMAWAKAQGMV